MNPPPRQVETDEEHEGRIDELFKRVVGGWDAIASAVSGGRLDETGCHMLDYHLRQLKPAAERVYEDIRLKVATAPPPPEPQPGPAPKLDPEPELADSNPSPATGEPDIAPPLGTEPAAESNTANSKPQPVSEQRSDQSQLPPPVAAVFGALSLVGIVITIAVAPSWAIGAAIAFVVGVALLHKWVWKWRPRAWALVLVIGVTAIGGLVGSAVPLRAAPITRRNHLHRPRRPRPQAGAPRASHLSRFQILTPAARASSEPTSIAIRRRLFSLTAPDNSEAAATAL
jgi:hypothetical protein